MEFTPTNADQDLVNFKGEITRSCIKFPLFYLLQHLTNTTYLYEFMSFIGVYKERGSKEKGGDRLCIVYYICYVIYR